MRILIVDDDSVVLDLIAEQLGEHGYSVVAVRGVEAALKALAEDRFLLVLSDIRMVPRDGYALLRDVRDRGSELPVLLMSSFSPAEAPEQAEEAGAAGFLRKPFTEQQLVDAVSGALPQPSAVESL
jgi:two-component system response regulator FlrC